MSGSGDGGVHILVFPFPAQGHMIPLLDLSGQLSRRGHKITILVTPKNLSILAPLLSAHPSIQPLVLPFPGHPGLPSGVENIRDVGNRGNASMISALTGLAGPVSAWFKAHPSPPRAIISDLFLGWTQPLAHRLGIPRVVFFPVGCFLSTLHVVLHSDVARFKALEVVEFTDMPRSPSFKKDHLPSVFRLYDESDPDWRVVRNCLLTNLSSWGFVFNSFDVLEGDYLEHLRKLVGHDRVYGVGPIRLIGGSDQGLNRANPDRKDHVDCDVLQWLDGCEDGSVLYVSFGSQLWLTNPQREAMGRALERSSARFVWVVPSGPGGLGDGPFLGGFEERVSGRGFLLKGWAPQVEILSHRAVSAFLSHCGWNAVMESVVAGVMMLTWPMDADQFVNSKLLEDVGMAVRACEGPDAVPDPDQLGRVMREAMSAMEVVLQKRRVGELKKAALAAVRDGGSSANDLNRFLYELVRSQNVDPLCVH